MCVDGGREHGERKGGVEGRRRGCTGIEEVAVGRRGVLSGLSTICVVRRLLFNITSRPFVSRGKAAEAVVGRVSVGRLRMVMKQCIL